MPDIRYVFELYGKTRAHHKAMARAHLASDLLWLYLGGPMMWCKDFNFGSFDDGRDRLEAHDEVHVVFSPADNDRAQGFEGTGLAGTPDDLVGVKFNRREALRQDMDWIAQHSDGMVVLPGWEKSDGTRAEVAFHQGLHLPVWELEAFLSMGVYAPTLATLGLPDAPPAYDSAVPCPHDHAGGHKAYPFGDSPGRCWCGTDGCEICPDVTRARASLPRVRTFGTGADRDTAEHKIDPEGALSPVVLERYARYMLAHSIRRDGSRRRSDNWQRGMPLDSYMSSLGRHHLQAWLAHRGHEPLDDDGQLVPIEDALCGVLFNTMGYLHEVLTGDES